jgi:hypothetical protein
VGYYRSYLGLSVGGEPSDEAVMVFGPAKMLLVCFVYTPPNIGCIKVSKIYRRHIIEI